MAAGIVIRDGTNTPRTITEIVVRDATNTPRTITEIWVRDANNVPRLVWDPTGVAEFDVSASPASVFGSAPSGTVAVTGSTTATPDGGTGPYTYLWSIVAWSAVNQPTANSPTSATTTFTQTGLSPDTGETATFQVVVTDSLGNTASATVMASFFGPTGGGITP